MAIEPLDAICEKNNVDAIGELMDLMGLYVRTNFYNNIHNYIDKKNIDDGGVNGATHIVMYYLYQVNHPVSVSHLVKRLMINNISRFISRLEEKGFIERNFGKSDKRITEISISDKGREFMTEYYRQYDQAAKEFMTEVFTDEQREELKELLLRVVGMLKKIPSSIGESEKILMEMHGEKVDLSEELN